MATTESPRPAGERGDGATAGRPAGTGRRPGAFRGVHLACLAAGALLVAFFFGLRETATGIEVVLGPRPYTGLAAGELHFWLAQTLLLLPAGALIGVGASPWLGPLLGSWWTALGEATARERALVPLAFSVLYVAFARLGRRLVLHDLAVTDEENTVRFGGQLLARGEIAIPRDLPHDVYPLRFLFESDGFVTSFDFVGTQLAWALAELTGLGPWVFAAIAAVPLGAVAAVVAREASWRWGIVAMVLLAASPMFAFLSMTTHAHLVLRAAVAVFYAGVCRGWAGGGLPWWVGAGVAGGAAFLARPAEAVLLLAPFGAAIALDALWRRPGGGVPAIGLAVGAAPALAVYLLHNWAVTGQPLLQARFVANEFRHDRPPISDPKLEFLRSWEVFASRFGANVGFNVLRSIVWFAGLPALFLAALGLRSRFSRLVLAGLLGHLVLLGMLHDNHGVHPVGPIHQGELAPGLAILATLGLRALVLRLRPVVAPRLLASIVSCVLVVGLGVFSSWHGRTLWRMTGVQARILDFTDETDLPPRSVLLLPEQMAFWSRFPDFPGSWMFGWRDLDPEADVVKLLYDPETLPELAERYPDRDFFVMVPTDEEPYMAIGRLPREAIRDPDARR